MVDDTKERIHVYIYNQSPLLSHTNTSFELLDDCELALSSMSTYSFLSDSCFDKKEYPIDPRKKINGCMIKSEKSTAT